MTTIYSGIESISYLFDCGYEPIIARICTLHQQILKIFPRKSINDSGIASGFFIAT
jgi:hypothetical protein